MAHKGETMTTYAATAVATAVPDGQELVTVRDLSRTEIETLSSPYLADGVYQDRIAIHAVRVSGSHLTATVAVTDFGISPTDRGGYHLTAPTVFRMVGQVVVIHGHALLNLTAKEVEVWVKEHSMKHRA